jgi:outer membrane biogenesis lipoprotein LolB
MLRLRLFVLLLPVILFQTGCSSTSTASAPPQNNIDSSGQAVSSTPWNKPESWETQGQLGALAH